MGNVFLVFYLVGLALALGVGLFGLFFGVQTGGIDVQAHTEEGRRQIGMALLLDTLAHAAIWPLSMPFQIAAIIEHYRQGRPIEFQFREKRQIKQPGPECGSQMRVAVNVIGECLNQEARLTGVTPVPLAAALAYQAWFQMWTEARVQGLSNEDARWNYLCLCERASSGPPDGFNGQLEEKQTQTLEETLKTLEDKKQMLEVALKKQASEASSYQATGEKLIQTMPAKEVLKAEFDRVEPKVVAAVADTNSWSALGVLTHRAWLTLRAECEQRGFDAGFAREYFRRSIDHMLAADANGAIDRFEQGRSKSDGH